MIDSWFLRCCIAAYSCIIRIGSNLQSIFLLYMRLTWGYLIFLIGVHKFQQMDQTVAFFENLQISHPSWSAHLVATFELIGGLFLVLGFASRLIAIPLIIIMITALSLEHAQDMNRFSFLLEPSSLVLQAPYPYLITAILMFLFGPGIFSFDHVIKKYISNKK